MKLIRFGEPGKEKPGVEAGEKRLDLSEHFKDWNRGFFNGGGMARLQTVLQNEGGSLPAIPADARLGACVARPGKHHLRRTQLLRPCRRSGYESAARNRFCSSRPATRSAVPTTPSQSPRAARRRTGKWSWA